MKNILSIAFFLVAFAANGQIQEYVIEASDSLITRGVLQIDADKFKATTQVSSDDTTLVSLDYLTNLLDNAEYADSLAFHSGTGYLVYYREGVALDSTSLDGRYQATLTNPVTGTGTTNYLPKWTGLGTLGNSLIYDNGTNVGIGTTAPNGKIDISGTSTPTIRLTNSNATNYNATIGLNYNNQMFYIKAGLVNILKTYGFQTPSGLGLGVYNYEDAIYINNTGNIGISTTTPTQKLDVDGNIRVRSVGTNTTSTVLGLDSNGNLTTNVSITGGATWKGGWNASTNTPTLSDATGTNGWWYKVTVAGTQNLGSGSITFAVGDDVIHNGTIWQKFSASISESDPVFVASDVYEWTEQDSIEWSTAYSWGDHSTVGYALAANYVPYTGATTTVNLGSQALTTTGNITGNRLISTVATGTAPLSVTSKTLVTNLNADRIDNVEGERIVYGDNATATTRVSDLNTIDKSGFYFVPSSNTGAPTASPYNVIHSNYDGLGAYSYQIASLFDTSIGKFYMRQESSVDGTWQDWRELYHTGNFTDNSNNWNAAYNDKINSAAFSGTTTKTLTMTQQDGGTVTANFTDLVDDADASATNEGSLTVTAGTATTSVINSNTSGSTPVTLSVDGTNLGISESGNTITLANLKPDQTVSLTGSGATSVSGTYPNFTISSTDNNTTYTGSAGVQLVGNDFRMNIGSLNAGAISASTHYIPWYQTTGAHWRTTLAELQAVAGYNAGKIQNVTVSSTAPTTDYVLKYNGTTWAPAPDATGAGALTSGDAINVTGDSINYKPTRITATMTDLNMLNNAASIVTNFEYGGSIYRTTLGQLSDLGLYNARELRGYTIASATPSTGEVLKWTGSQWEPEPDATGGMTDPMTTRGDIIYRNSSNVTARLASGTSGQLLYSNGTDIYWRSPIKSDIGLGNVENTALSTWTGSTNLSTVGSITQGNWGGDPISAVKGGTGKTSYTAYALLAGGTTSTGTLQQVSGVGTAGQVLTSNGAGALPSWQAASAGGWVDNGTDVVLSNTSDNVAIGASSAGTGNKLLVNGNIHTSSIFISSYITFNQLSGYLGSSSNPWLYTMASDGGLIYQKGSSFDNYRYHLTSKIQPVTSSTATISYSTGDLAQDTLTANTTYNITYIPDGAEGEIFVRQDGAGGWTLTLNMYPLSTSSTALAKVTVGATTGIKTTANKHTLIRYRRWGTKVTLEYLQEP